MKSHALFCLLALFGLLAISSKAQTWNELDLGFGTQFDSENFNKVYFIDDQVGFILSLNGDILRTNDGGSSWSIVASATNYLYEMTFATTSVGYVNGMKTTDGGLTWTAQSSSENFRYMHALSENHILASMAVGGGNTLFESIDGGTTWVQTVSPELENLDPVYSYATREYSFIDDQTGYAALKKNSLTHSDTLWIMRTVDSGTNWDFVSVPSPTPIPGGGLGFSGFYSLDFATLDTGLVIHDFGLLKTADGGNSWTEIRPASAPSNFGFTTIYANSGSHFITAGFVPFTTNLVEVLYETFDGGITWNAPVSLADLGFQDVTCNSQRCFAVGVQGKVYSQLLDSSSLSTQELLFDELTVFPNPSSNYIEYTSENGAGSVDLVEITNMKGQKMKVGISEGNRIDVSDLENGVYFICFSINGAPCVKRFVKN